MIPNTIRASQGEMQTDAVNAQADAGIFEGSGSVIDDMLDHLSDYFILFDHLHQWADVSLGKQN